MTAEVCGKPYWVGVSRATVTTDGKQRRCINTIKRTRGIALTIDPANICLNLILPRDVRSMLYARKKPDGLRLYSFCIAIDGRDSTRVYLNVRNPNILTSTD